MKWLIGVTTVTANPRFVYADAFNQPTARAKVERSITIKKVRGNNNMMLNRKNGDPCAVQTV